MNYINAYESPIGKLLVASDGVNILGLWIEGQKYFCDKFNLDEAVKEDLPVFEKIKKWLDRYFDGKNPKIDELPLAPVGSPFRQNVWKILCEIPYGETTTYGTIAKRIAALENKTTMSGQAVGGAVGHNPISIIIPCHRVLGADGSLTGYAGGIENKIKLLEHEGVEISKL